MVRSGRFRLAAALILACSSGTAMAQQPLVFTSQEPTPAEVSGGISGPIPTPPAPAAPSPIPQFDPIPSSAPASAAPLPQAACCGATAAVAARPTCCQPAAPPVTACCAPAPVTTCCAAQAPAPVATCGCAVGAAASFAAFQPAEVYPGGPNSYGTSYGGSYSAGMGVIAAPGYGPVASGQVVGSPYAPGYSGYTTGYAGGYAAAGYGSAVSGAWPTYFGQNAGATAFEGYPMGYAAGGTAGEHLRHPFYNDRRPWYTPGPGARTVSIVW